MITLHLLLLLGDWAMTMQIQLNYLVFSTRNKQIHHNQYNHLAETQMKYWNSWRPMPRMTQANTSFIFYTNYQSRNFLMAYKALTKRHHMPAHHVTQTFRFKLTNKHFHQHTWHPIICILIWFVICWICLWHNSHLHSFLALIWQLLSRRRILRTPKHSLGELTAAPYHTACCTASTQRSPLHTAVDSFTVQSENDHLGCGTDFLRFWSRFSSQRARCRRYRRWLSSLPRDP